MPRVIRLESRHALPFAREQLWPVLSRTDWLNRAVGLPPVEYDLRPRAEGGSEVTARARMLGRELRWREPPFEWLEPEYYHVRRVFFAGPFAEGFMGMELRADGPAATTVIVFSELTPRHALGAWLARGILGPKTRRDMTAVMAHVSEHLRGRTPVVMPRLPTHAVNEPALQAGLSQLRESGQAGPLLNRLDAFLRQAPDVELSHIRPWAVARVWGQERWAVLRLFLHATRAGLLDLSWELLCPNCRTAPRAPAAALSALAGKAHCDVCQIQFDAAFDQSVELKFAVHAAVRPRESRTFCLAGPGSKPHILSQLVLAAGERRLWKLPDLSQPSRLRSPQVKAPLPLRRQELGTEGGLVTLLCQPEGFGLVRSDGPPSAGAGIEVLNPNPFPVLLVLERVAWSEEILTAAQVTSWQDFRDLFSQEVISPGEELTVGAQVVLFTDLRGSTAMYQGLGDAPAYALVRAHFGVLLEAVRAHHGAVVKTIGDAVMAAFTRVDEALEAVRQMHERVAQVTASPALALKSSLHVGPCLAVNANGKLDFFGTTVNLAARMVGRSQGGDLVVSDDLYCRPEMDAFRQTLPHPPEPAEVQFRGFEAPHRVWRLRLLA